MADSLLNANKMWIKLTEVQKVLIQAHIISYTNKSTVAQS